MTSQERQQWETDGYVRLGQVASAPQLSALQRRIDEIMLGKAPTDGIWFQLDSPGGDYGTLKFTDGQWPGPSLDFRKIERLERDPVFLDYMRHPRFRDITRELIGSEVTAYRAMFMNKPAGRGTHLPYHQDGGSQWQLSADPVMTIWTALDDSTVENGCVQVVPGSHRLGLLSEHGHTITPEQEARFAPEGRSVFLEARAGEAILLHNLLLHRSGVNPTDRPRRAFSVCYMDASTRDVSGAGKHFPLIFGAESRG